SCFQSFRNCFRVMSGALKQEAAEPNSMKSVLLLQNKEGRSVKFGQENIGELKNQMKEALAEEYAELKSGIRPSIATR
ncbi:Hypothetical protein FKW44_023845, partial [Caligus rogercresseyi]